MHIMEALVRKWGEPHELEVIRVRYELLPRMPKVFPQGCKGLWRGVGVSFILQQDYAALSTMCVFVETLLVEAINETRDQIRRGTSRSKFPAHRLGDEMPEGMMQKVMRAGSYGVITKAEKQMLADFTQLVRNRLLHGDLVALANTFQQVQKVSEYDPESGDVVEVTGNRLAAIVDDVITATIELRIDRAIKEITPKIVPAMGRWARACAVRVWNEPPEALSDDYPSHEESVKPV